MPKFLTNLDLNQNQLIKARIENYAGNPNGAVTGVEGQLIWDSTGDKLYACTGGTNWVVASGEIVDTNTTYAISAETVSGGANLRLTAGGSGSGTDDVKFAGSGAASVSRTDDSTITISATDTNTTYSISATTTTGGANLRLTDSGAGTDDVKFAGSGAVSVAYTDDNTITITGTDTNTATAADDILDGSNIGTEVKYAPYATQQAGLSFDTSATAPTGTTRLNLNGNLYATNMVAGTILSDDVKASAAGATPDIYSEVTTGSITIGTGLTTGSLNLASSGTGATPINVGHTNATTTVTGTVKLPTVGTAGLVALGAGGELSAQSLGSGVATFLATPSSANLASAITDETGTAGNLVFSTGPTLSGPIIDDIKASATSTAGDIFSEITTGSIAIGAGLTTGDITIAGSQTSGGEITLGSSSSLVKIPGNLTVDGTVITVNSNEVNIGDSNILLNADITTNAANSDGGVSVKRLMADNSTRKDAVIEYNNTSNRWQVTFGDVTGTLITQAIPMKYTTTVGDTSETTFTVTHNLNSRDVHVTVRETSDDYEEVYADIKFPTVNTITVTFAVAPGTDAYTVTVIG